MRFLPAKVLIRAAVLAAASVTAIALAVPSAKAATSACGSVCVSLYPLSYGTSDVLAVKGASGTNAWTGEPIAIATASSTSQAEDWSISQQATVSEFYTAGLMSAAMNLHWGSDEAYEFAYTPGGTWTGLCMGTSTATALGRSLSRHAAQRPPPCGSATPRIKTGALSH